ncbi:hypothetical protein EV189_3465 [Motilibacter rhizosphaerae]|uniref:Carboxypeptidase family protein n=1 Tax=Motilibacter rhizosphaerae TaxID=598652 RepID=A0A4Q7NAR4_9ACTN|nr:hypothetical protein [Motilibacter rhizosphaerae]RZS79986.1 hypothetical protein EV189_3465 [Motilibacter rhizosphaerae]
MKRTLAALVACPALSTGLVGARAASAASAHALTVRVTTTSRPSLPSRLPAGTYVLDVTGGSRLQVAVPAEGYTLQQYARDDRVGAPTRVTLLGGAPSGGSVAVALTAGRYWFYDPFSSRGHVARMRQVVVTGVGRGALPRASRVLVGLRQPEPDVLPHAVVARAWWTVEDVDTLGPARSVEVYRVPAGTSDRELEEELRAWTLPPRVLALPALAGGARVEVRLGLPPGEYLAVSRYPYAPGPDLQALTRVTVRA